MSPSRLAPALLVSMLAACSGSSPAPAPTASTGTGTGTSPDPGAASTASGGPSLPTPVLPGSPPVRVTAPACGYGGSATAIAIFLDIETDVALRDLAVSFEATDRASGARIGGPSSPMRLSVVPASHSLLDFSSHDATPLPTELAAASRTRVYAFSGLDGMAPGVGPIDLAITFTANGGAERVALSCATDAMWPSS